MKKYTVSLQFEYDGYNGYEHRETHVAKVLARNEDSALKKAKKQLRDYGSVIGFDVADGWRKDEADS